jgi:hypothetical protein
MKCSNRYKSLKIHITEEFLKMGYGHTCKFGIGKHLEIIFTLETIGKDTEVKNDFSNIKAYNFNTLDDCLERFNLYQKHGYNNLQIITRVNYKNKPVIEDVTSCMELSVNSSFIEEIRKENEQLKKQFYELTLYKEFITKHNATKLYDKFVKDKENIKPSNTDNDNLYWYEFRLRGFSPSCQPKGHITVKHDIGRYGIIAYDRQLTETELYDYDLKHYQTA